MNALRVLVTGAHGQVGVDLIDVLHGRVPPGGDVAFQPDGRAVREGEFEVRGVDRRELDVTNGDAVSSVMRQWRPDVVVHLAAYTAVDRAEDDRDRCFTVNDVATGTLSEAADDLGAHLITISTDYVFDGRLGRGYVETDVANPLNAYGASKYAGELRCSPEDTIVRTSWVMGVRGTSVVHVIADRAMAGLRVRFVDDQRGTVTAASDLARSLVCLIRDRPGGLWHVANVGDTTWFDVAAYVGHVAGRDDDFASPIATTDLDPVPLATRPARSDLTTHKFAQHYSALPSWREALGRLVGERGDRGTHE